MIQIPELNIEVEDVSDFNDEAGEILTAFCEELKNKGELRPVDESRDYCPDDNVTHLWSDNASKLIDDEIDRLYKIGEKYFGETLDLDISTHMYKEL